MNSNLICKLCKKTYKTRKDKILRSKYCSKLCHNRSNAINSKVPLTIIACALCNIHFGFEGSQEPNRKFCSLKCKYNARKWHNFNSEKQQAIILEKFNKHIIKKENDCWNWNGTKMNKGYGIISYGDYTLLLHRASWEIHKGSIPKGFHVCHKCDNPICSNPYHLFLGTAKDNVKDMWDKKRNKGNFKKGIIPKNRKLTKEQIMLIKNQLTEGKTSSSIAKLHEVHKSVILDIKHNKTYKDFLK